MKIEKLLFDSNIDYKKIDADKNFLLLKVANRKLLAIITSKDSQFLFHRDIFEYLDGNQLPYSLLLIDEGKSKLYYLHFKMKQNWIKSCFDSCDKEEIFLGKQVLNNAISEGDLVAELRK